MKEKLHILVLEDHVAEAELMIREIERAGFDAQWRRVETEPDFLRELERPADLILADYSLPRFNGMRALQILKERELDIPFILVSGTVGEETAVESIKQGASDYVLKDRLIRLGHSARRALEEKRNERQWSAFAALGSQLGAAGTAREAAAVIVRTADELFGWDACSLDLYESESDTVLQVLAMDIVDGRRQDVSPAYANQPPSPGCRQAIEKGGRLILRRDPKSGLEDFTAFGDSSRPSASMLIVPVRRAEETIAVFSIHSYAADAYNDEDLAAMEALADHCGGALAQIRSRDALRESEKRFRQLTDNIEEVFWLLDLKQNRLLYLSPACEKVWGRPCEALLRSTQEWEDSIHLEDREWVLKAMAAHKQEFGDYDHTYRITLPDGETRWIHERGFPIRDPSGEYYRIAGLAQDITEKKNFEKLLMRNQRLESIGALAGGIAHDLNNVLGPILMAVHILQNEIQSNEGRAVLETLQSCAQRGADLVQQVLSFARGAEGEQTELNLSHILKDARQIVRKTFPKNIEATVHTGLDLWTVSGNATQLHQVFMNLCVNARDAMPQGGRLTVKAENATLDEIYTRAIPDARPGEYVCVTVEDTGLGVSPEIRERIFEPFFTTKEIGKGTGLGLSTSIGIVKSHGGFINLYSEPGKGTCFKVFLPAASKTKWEESGDQSGEAVSKGKGECVLVVDDEESFRDMTRKILERSGYRVLLATHGAEAVAMYALQQKQIAVVITDLAMPVMDGPSTIAALKSMNPKARIICSSGLGMEGTITQAFRAGADEFVSKPYTSETLLKAIEQVLRKTE